MNTRILVVDDEPANRFLLENILGEYQVTSVGGGEEMWEKIDACDPSLILMDVMLPGKDGFQLVSELSAHDRYFSVPVIFLSALSDPSAIVTGFELGGYDYIRKPFGEVELLARIKSALRKTEERDRLNRDIIHDPLTGLYNRRYLEDFIRREEGKTARNLSRFSGAMLDIDLFKSLNDSRGHQCGDYVLQTFAGVIRDSLRSYDIAIRYGGEEFLLILPAINRSEASVILERVRKNNAEHPYEFAGERFQISFTCGIADFDDIGSSKAPCSALIQVADLRLYKGKKGGRNMIVSDDVPLS